uniref:Putative ovule protein n=1 Tax=Solanum chacoense TaxID=4108 RepID=A0A0V0HGG4_SOLCH
MEYEDMPCENGIPTMITWSHGGHEVAIEGSWDGWKTKDFLQRTDKDFTVMKVLPSGVYHYRFIVDGQWRYAPDLPCEGDDTGNVFNVLDLQDIIPEVLNNTNWSEAPPSPESSYSNAPFSSEDFNENYLICLLCYNRHPWTNRLHLLVVWRHFRSHYQQY